MKSLVGIIVVIHCVFVNAKFTWLDCSPKDSPIHITNVEMGPDPLVIPGDITLTLQGASNQPIGSSAIHMSIKRKTFLGEFSIPCVGNVGSCTYLDTCTILDQMIRENWMGITTDLGNQVKAILASSGLNATHCPQPANNILIDHQSFHIPEVPSALSHFAAGDYHVVLYMTDNTSGKTTLCVEARFTMAEKEPCTGILCIFGK